MVINDLPAYMADRPMAQNDIMVGAEVLVPYWRNGDIVDWVGGCVTEIDTDGGRATDKWYVVSLPDATEQGYYAYSVKCRVCCGNVERECHQCKRV